MSETPILCGSLNQTGNIRNREFPVVMVLILRSHPHKGIDRRKRIRGALRSRIGQSGEKRRFPRIGKPDQSDVRDRLQRKGKLAELSRLAFGKLARSLVGGRLEVKISQSTLSSFQQTVTLIVLEKLTDDPTILVLHSRPNRNHERLIVPVLSILLTAFATLSVLRLPMRLETECPQVADIAICLQIEIPPFAAIASIGPTLGNIFSPMKTGTTVPTVSGTKNNSGLIVKHNW